MTAPVFDSTAMSNAASAGVPNAAAALGWSGDAAPVECRRDFYHGLLDLAEALAEAGRALLARRLARLGATPDFTTGC